MTRKLLTVSPVDKMSLVKEIFDNHRIHHIPVVKYTTLVGIISKTDFVHFLKGMNTSPYDKIINDSRLERYKVEEIMTKGIATLESTDRMNVALQVFSENLFHAIPIVDNEEIVGILTTYDVIKMLLEEDNERMKAN
ncbi:MAG TPA: CBS domain-containing protein [Saprospiraceae bacterium]|nr:CBS domain-containing protein [Saprospiraceae bacterium]